jgi:hypothetical protein
MYEDFMGETLRYSLSNIAALIEQNFTDQKIGKYSDDESRIHKNTKGSKRNRRTSLPSNRKGYAI